MLTSYERDLTKPDHLMRASFYCKELRCSSSRDCPQYGNWGHPGRIWVRGYDKEARIVYEQTIGYADMRYTGPRSRCGRLIALADRIAHSLTRVSQHVQRRGGLELTGLDLDNIYVTDVDSDAVWCALDSQHNGISARELLQLDDNVLNRQLIFAAAIRQGVFKGRPKKAA